MSEKKKDVKKKTIDERIAEVKESMAQFEKQAAIANEQIMLHRGALSMLEQMKEDG